MRSGTPDGARPLPFDLRANLPPVGGIFQLTPESDSVEKKRRGLAATIRYASSFASARRVAKCR